MSPGHRFGRHSSVTGAFQTSPFRRRLVETSRRIAFVSCGPRICFRLLPTPPRGDAVTFSYGGVASSDTDLHRADQAPSWAHDEQRIVALICLLSIALRVLVLMQFVVRRNLRQASATLKGIYPGQPGRQTAQPTTEMMLGALRGVTLSRLTIDGKRIYHLTPLNAVQKRILVLMEVPIESYNGLVT